MQELEGRGGDHIHVACSGRKFHGKKDEQGSVAVVMDNENLSIRGCGLWGVGGRLRMQRV